VTTDSGDDWISAVFSLGIDTENSGIKTFDAYLYQAKVAFSWALHLALDAEKSRKKLESLVFEAHEDFIAVWVDKDTGKRTMELVQVKAVNPKFQSASSIVEHFELGEMFIRYKNLEPRPDASWNVSLATHAPVTLLKETLTAYAKNQKSPPAALDNFVASINAAIKRKKPKKKTSSDKENVARGDSETIAEDQTKSKDELTDTNSQVNKKDPGDEIRAFLRQLAVWSDFPASGHIDPWNMYRLYNLRVEQGGSLYSIKVDYEACLSALNKAFVGTDKGEDRLSRLGEVLDEKKESQIEIESRSLVAERILQLVHGPGSSSDLTQGDLQWRYQNAELAAQGFLDALSQLKSTAEMQEALKNRTLKMRGASGETSVAHLAPYLPYLPLEKHQAVEDVFGLVREGEEVDKIKQNILKLRSGLGEVAVSTDEREPVQTDAHEQRYITGLENLPVEDADFFRDAVEIVGPRLSKLTLGARQLLWNLIKKGSLHRDTYERIVRNEEQAQYLGPENYELFLNYEAELKEVWLATLESEDEGERDRYFATTHIQGFNWPELRDHLRLCGGDLESLILGLHTHVIHPPRY
jgi:hypothetical protein